jgi:hypothetical protein
MKQVSIFIFMSRHRGRVIRRARHVASPPLAIPAQKNVYLNTTNNINEIPFHTLTFNMGATTPSSK